MPKSSASAEELALFKLVGATQISVHHYFLINAGSKSSMLFWHILPDVVFSMM
jgi:hypothetical protein